MSTFSYLKNPKAIHVESFRRIRDEVDLSDVPEAMRAVILRLIHACGEPGIVNDLAWTDGAAEAGQKALREGAAILCDADMVARGVIRARLPADNDVFCTLALDGVAGAARRLSLTRSAAAVDYWRPWLEGAVVAIGNAPTALFRLLEQLQSNWPKPALILGFPVGFVGAEASKRALADYASSLGVPFLTLHGRRGGSALAAAAVNALARGNEEDIVS